MPYSHCGCATMIEPGLRSRNLRCGQALMNISVPTVGMGGTSDEGDAGKRKCERTIMVSCQRHLHLASPLVAIGPSVGPKWSAFVSCATDECFDEENELVTP